jgi:hypothetical protein
VIAGGKCFLKINPENILDGHLLVILQTWIFHFLHFFAQRTKNLTIIYEVI